MRGRKFVGDKRGGKYLRPPDIYHTILGTYGEKLVRLRNVATIRAAIKTGANDFFYLTPERISEFGIEPEYRRPVITAPQESPALAVDVSALPKQVFSCHLDEEHLERNASLVLYPMGRREKVPPAA